MSGAKRVSRGWSSLWTVWFLVAWYWSINSMNSSTTVAASSQLMFDTDAGDGKTRYRTADLEDLTSPMIRVGGRPA